MSSASHRANRKLRHGTGGEIGKRSIMPRHPARPRSSVMAAPLRRLATIARFEPPVWTHDADEEGQPIPRREVVTITAVLTDGRRVSTSESVAYAKGEREAILWGLTDDARAEAGMQAARRLLDARLMLMNRMRSALQREYCGCEAAA